jgi:hypothetical protein
MSVTTDDLAEWEVAKLQEAGLTTAMATAATLPSHSGDGYGYGGGALVIIGGVAIPLGEGTTAIALSKEIANRWNRGITQ